MKLIKPAIVALAALTITAPALACSCAFPQSVEQQFEQAGLVFTGTVIDTGPEEIKAKWWHWLTPWRERPKPAWNDEHATTFQIDRMLKGPDTLDTITFVHGVSGASCGVTFRTQQSGVFIGYEKSDGTYSTNLCTSPRFTAAEFIAASEASD